MTIAYPEGGGQKGDTIGIQINIIGEISIKRKNLGKGKERLTIFFENHTLDLNKYYSHDRKL